MNQREYEHLSFDMIIKVLLFINRVHVIAFL